MQVTKSRFTVTRRPQKVKFSRTEIRSPVHTLPEIRFEDQRLPSFAGSVVLHALFQKLSLKDRLRRCFAHLPGGQIVGYPTICFILIVTIMLGFRRLRDIDRYRDDPLLVRVLGLKRIPHVSTICRALQRIDGRSVDAVGAMNRDIVLDRLEQEQLPRVTLDFDGSVIASSRFAEGLAVGYNKHKKGRRSYYPLFCTVAQSAQVVDVQHRPGNVHDSNGALEFMKRCITSVRERLPSAVLESRKDSAFFSDETVSVLDSEGVLFTVSVPFERFAELKGMIESRKQWRPLSRDWSCFESWWAPKSWQSAYRFIVYRHRVRIQNKEPLQLDLFAPVVHGYEFRVIVTNKRESAKSVLDFHNGRGSQENIFSELKSQCGMEYVPTRRLSGNRLYCLSSILAYNLFKELQMIRSRPIRISLRKRPSLWNFSEPRTIQQHIIHRAGRLTNPHGRLTLTMCCNPVAMHDFQEYLASLLSSA